jgi:hypothetical protein
VAILWSEHIFRFYQEIDLEFNFHTSDNIETGTEFRNKEKKGEKVVRGETELRVRSKFSFQFSGIILALSSQKTT